LVLLGDWDFFFFFFFMGVCLDVTDTLSRKKRKRNKYRTDLIKGPGLFFFLSFYFFLNMIDTSFLVSTPPLLSSIFTLTALLVTLAAYFFINSLSLQ